MNEKQRLEGQKVSLLILRTKNPPRITANTLKKRLLHLH